MATIPDRGSAGTNNGILEIGKFLHIVEQVAVLMIGKCGAASEVPAEGSVKALRLALRGRKKGGRKGTDLVDIAASFA